MALATRAAQHPASSATTTTSPSLLEIQDHARLIEHHAAHASNNASANRARAPNARSSAPRALAAGLWTPPAPSHGVRGGDTSSNWTNPASWPEQRGTPSYRPIDTQLDHTRRPWANTTPEIIFTVTMIGLGVQTIGIANTIFRNTVGKIGAVNNYFRYQAPHEI